MSGSRGGPRSDDPRSDKCTRGGSAIPSDPDPEAVAVDGACCCPVVLDGNDFLALRQVDDVSDFHCVTGLPASIHSRAPSGSTIRDGRSATEVAQSLGIARSLLQHRRTSPSRRSRAAQRLGGSRRRLPRAGGGCYCGFQPLKKASRSADQRTARLMWGLSPRCVTGSKLGLPRPTRCAESDAQGDEAVRAPPPRVHVGRSRFARNGQAFFPSRGSPSSRS
jgi:hypothetical protein